MKINTTKIIFAIAAVAILAACKDDKDFYQASSVNARYRSDAQAPPSTTSGFFMGDAPKTGRGASGAPPSTTATTSDAQVPAPAPSDAAPPSTTSSTNAPAAAPSAASSEAPPSIAPAAPPSAAQ